MNGPPAPVSVCVVGAAFGAGAHVRAQRCLQGEVLRILERMQAQR